MKVLGFSAVLRIAEARSRMGQVSAMLVSGFGHPSLLNPKP